MLDGRAIPRRIATYAPGSVVPALVALITSVAFTRIFSAAELGEYGLVLVAANTLKVALTMWISQGIGKFVPPAQTLGTEPLVKAAIALSAVFVLIVEGIIGVAVLLFAASTHDSSGLELAFAGISYVVVSSAFDTVWQVLPAQHRAAESVSFRLSDSVATLGLRLLLVSSLVGMGVSAMLWSVVLSNGFLIPFVWIRSGLPGLLRLARLSLDAATGSMMRAMFGYGLPMTFWYLGSMLLDVGDRFLIGHFLGPADVGIYDANYRLITGTVALMVVPITMTLHPYMMEAASSKQPSQVAQALKAIVEGLVVLGTLAVGLTTVMYPYLALLLGVEFRSGAFIMPIVLAGVFAFNIGTFVHKPFEMSGRTGPMVACIFLAATANIALNILLLPLIGYVAAAYSTLISYLLYTVAVGWQARGVLRWRFDSTSVMRQLIPVVMAVGILYLARRLLYGSGSVSGASAVTAACGAAACWFVVRLARQVSSGLSLAPQTAIPKEPQSGHPDAPV